MSLAPASGARSGPSAELYVERGLAAGVALVIAPAMVSDGGVPHGDERLTALRFALPAPAGWALSWQQGLVEGPRRDGDGDFLGAETRLAIGRGWSSGWVDLEIARRSCGVTASTRWEGALGHRLDNGSALIVKGFGEDSGCAAPRARVQASWVMPVSRDVSVEIGWRQTVSSRDGWNQQGLVVGFWRSY